MAKVYGCGLRAMTLGTTVTVITQKSHRVIVCLLVTGVENQCLKMA